MGMYASVDLVLSTLGVITNAITIRTFLAMGADDGVTVSMLFLSSSELLCCLAALGQKLSILFWVTEMATKYTIRFRVNPYVFNIYFGNIRGMLFAVPSLITTYLAVVKCMCVVKPLSFKNTFSVLVTFRVMKFICVIAVVTYVPIMATMGVTDQFDVKINATRRSMWFSPYRDLVKSIVWNGRDTFIAITSQLIIVTCVVLMSRSLIRTVQVREKMRSGTFSRQRTDASDEVVGAASKISGKELLVIKQVIFISIVYVVSNTPKIFIFLAVASVPELTQGGLYQNLYEVILKGKEHFEIYASVFNIFIYYKYNSKFKEYCKY
ncbi:unnamed protein product [Lymnaea stagnalis]|uniref:G-protein coupled receptors family 1 profile domain-containing protein n=1 Tax=Lymnaea stagnalis TaxID=6523 RepID=A0AAV2IG42_LYMST